MTFPQIFHCFMLLSLKFYLQSLNQRDKKHMIFVSQNNHFTLLRTRFIRVSPFEDLAKFHQTTAVIRTPQQLRKREQ